MKIQLKISFLVCMIFFSGCASTKQLIKQPEEPVSQNKSIIELRRAIQYCGCGGKIDVYDNEKNIGQLGFNKNLIWQRDEGELIIRAEPRMQIFNLNKFNPLKLDVEGGKKYYLRFRWPLLAPIFRNAIKVTKVEDI